MGNVWSGDWKSADISWYTKNTSANTYILNTADELAGLSKLFMGKNKVSFRNKSIRLGSDIVLNDTFDWKTWETNPPVNKWIPIGDVVCDDRGIGWYGFDGTFDGDGHTISGMYIDSSMSIADNVKLLYPNRSIQVSLGLFGVITKSVVNLKVTDSVVFQKSCGDSADARFDNHSMAGILGGFNGGNCRIERCYVNGNVICKSYQCVGGMVGWNHGKVKQCVFKGCVRRQRKSCDIVGGGVGNVFDCKWEYKD